MSATREGVRPAGRHEAMRAAEKPLGKPPRDDPLALPAVPQPAPATHPWRDRIVIAMFVAALFVPLAGAIVKRNVTMTRFENRTAAPWPAPPSSHKQARAFTTAFEAAFADRFGGRDRLIAIHHATKALVFGVSPVANVLIGRDGWLYWRGEDGKAIERDFRGVLPYPDDEPARAAAELKRRHDFLAARGIAYVVVVAPDKATIYPEFLPPWVTRVAPASRLDRLYAALASYPDVTALDLRPALVAAKARERNYYKTDSHWNLFGASIGYEAIAAAVKAKVPAFPAAPAERPPYAPGVDVYSGDLARLLGLPRAFREDDIAPFGKVLADAAKRCAKPGEAPMQAASKPPGVEYEVYACNRPELPTAVVWRDSMAIPLTPLLSENFRRVVYVSGARFDRALIERERPDVVIEEMVERNVHMPIAYPM